jgi:hypothetical protein
MVNFEQVEYFHGIQGINFSKKPYCIYGNSSYPFMLDIY